MLRLPKRPPTHRNCTGSEPMSASSSRGKNTWGLPARSKVKKSASDIGMPSRTFLSELTPGLTRFCSMSEIKPLLTPARFASSRCDNPYICRTDFKWAPTSKLILSIILNTGGEQPAIIELSVDFPYHWGCEPSAGTVLRCAPQAGTACDPLSSRTHSMNAQPKPAPSPAELDAFWMPFTANRQFKANPRLLARADGMRYWTVNGR